MYKANGRDQDINNVCLRINKWERTLADGDVTLTGGHNH